MVVPYSSYPTINQLIGLSLDAATMGATTMGTTMGTSSDAADRATPQQHFLRLLQEAERRHRDTLQRAIQAEAQVQQLRQVFQQWQQQLQHQMQQQHQQQLQKLVDQELQQRQVQQQMQSLYDAVLQQQRQQTLVRRKVDEMVALQQQQQMQQQLQAFSSQQHLGQMQLQVLSLGRGQRAERRSRQALQRQVSQSRRWGCTPPPHQQPSPLACALPALPLATDKPVCSQDDCCPCEYPEECPFNPCLPEDCCDMDIPEGPNSNNCLLRDIRLGLVQPASCVECESQWRAPREVRRRIRYDSETESGYDADDEASLYSAASSKNSSAFVEERRHILQEVRSLENTRLTPRYKETYKPLRCFHCGKLDHLATFCPSLPVTIL